ncbi:hypothetical protein ACK3TF_005747 [Chlorella vulgaris]
MLDVRSDGLTIDQRLRLGIAPGKLVIPHELRAKLEGWPRLEQQGDGEEGGHSEELDSTSAVSNRPDWFTGRLRQSCSAVADSFTLLTLTYAVLDATFESPSREQQLSVLIPFDAEKVLQDAYLLDYEVRELRARVSWLENKLWPPND